MRIARRSDAVVAVGVAALALLSPRFTFAQASPGAGNQPAVLPPAAQPTLFELSELRILHDKGILSDAEYEGALHDISETSGGRAADSTTVVMGRFSTALYGFVEADGIYDSTQSFNEVEGNGQVVRAGTYPGDHDRSQMSIRNSRFGLRSQAPAFHAIRASLQIEMDFLGAVAPVGQSSPTSPYYGTEASFFTQPTLRARHANLKIETPIVDVLVGQYWALFGWQTVYHPNSVQIQGLPGQLYSRNVQLRVSKTVKTRAGTFEAAVAALRPPARDSAIPEGQAGLRFAVDALHGVQTRGATAKDIAPLSVAVTGDARLIRMPELSASPKNAISKPGVAVAADAFVPLVPADRDTMGNSLSLTGEFVSGYGDADQYTGLGGVGTAYPTLANPTMASPAPAYNPDVDPGIAQVDPTGHVHLIQWTSFILGAQYYLPYVDGHVWVSANYSQMRSANVQQFGPVAKVRSELDWWDVNLFGDITPAVRVGAEVAWTRDRYQDADHALNQRVQLSAFYVF